jgi:hypothetical protein
LEELVKVAKVSFFLGMFNIKIEIGIPESGQKSTILGDKTQGTVGWYPPLIHF